MALPVTRSTVKVTRQTVPTLAIERALWAGGADIVVGVDEVGRGAWAGPISVGAGPRVAGGVRRPRHVRRAEARRPTRHRRPRRRARRDPRRRYMGLRR